MSKDKARFTAPLEVTPLPDGKRWRTLRRFIYYRHGGDIPGYINRTREIDIIVVPAGFVTDFASIPAPFWSFIGGSWGRYGKAVVIHDYLYQNQGSWWSGLTRSGKVHRMHTGMSRRQADDIFLEAMVVLNVAPWRRRLMYRAVRLFGWLAWRQRR